MTGVLSTGQLSSSEELSARLFDATLGCLELFSVHIGWRLGLYEVLEDGNPITADELAARAGLDERYAREWLEQQAVAAFIAVEDEAAPAHARRYLLPEGHDEVLADAESPSFVAPFAPMVVGVATALSDVVTAYRTGAGVPYERYGADFREGQAAINRPAFVHELPNWLRAAPGVDERLRTTSSARVADVGCGLGASTLSIARTYEHATVTGIDSDAASIATATAACKAAGLHDRVSFRLLDAAGIGADGPYDLVCIFEALHDMARPADALRAAREALRPGGTVFIADERVADTFTAPGDPVERLMYGWSVSHCLPSARCEHHSAALGTALRADVVAALASEAGFARTEVLPVDNDFFRFYQLVP